MYTLDTRIVATKSYVGRVGILLLYSVPTLTDTDILILILIVIAIVMLDIYPLTIITFHGTSIR